jgi:hypothetical protein
LGRRYESGSSPLSRAVGSRDRTPPFEHVEEKEACARTIDGHHPEVARARIRNPAVFYPIARPDDSFGLSRSGSVAR